MTTNTDGAMPELPDNDIDGEEIGKIIADCTVTFEGGFSLDNDMFASVIRSAMEDYARAAIEQAAGEEGEIVVTKTDTGAIVSVTRQDAEGRILDVIAQDTQQAAGAVPEGCRIVPMEPSKAMLDRAVAFALNVSLGGSYGWTDYMRDLYARMLSAVPSKAGSSDHSVPCKGERTP